MSETGIEVRRYFPTFDFVIRTDLGRDAVIARLSEAMVEKSSKKWPRAKPHLSGDVKGWFFTCYTRTSPFGGNAVSKISGEIAPGPSGGSEVSVRVVDWLFFLVVGLIAAVSTYFGATASEPGEMLRALGTVGGISIVAAGFYGFEIRFIRSIFERIFSLERQAD